MTALGSHPPPSPKSSSGFGGRGGMAANSVVVVAPNKKKLKNIGLLLNVIYLHTQAIQKLKGGEGIRHLSL